MHTIARKIEASFSKAAVTYPSKANLQKKVAEMLAGMLPALDLPPGPILEIGCGTGFLSHFLVRHFSECVISDLSPEMVRVCADKLGGARASFCVLDGEGPLPPSSLVASSLAFQWFQRFEESVLNCVESLLPKGVLLFSTLASDSFPEWKEACRLYGVPYTGNPMPRIDNLLLRLPKETRCTEQKITIRYESARDFFKTLKQIGASLSVSQAPISLGAMRQLLHKWQNPEGIEITYSVAFILVRKP